MPQIRSEQLKNYTLTDAQIAINAAISQSKIADILKEPNGWLSKGIISSTTTLPTWDGTQAGRFYYDTTKDQLWMGTSVSPYAIMVSSADSADSSNLVTIVKEGSEATDLSNGIGRTFVSSTSFSIDGSDLFVYLNGTLQKFGTNDDFTILNTSTIKFNFDVNSSDRVSFVIVTGTFMNGYATKSTVEPITGSVGGSNVGDIQSGIVNIGSTLYYSGSTSLSGTWELYTTSGPSDGTITNCESFVGNGTQSAVSTTTRKYYFHAKRIK